VCYSLKIANGKQQEPEEREETATPESQIASRKRSK